MESIKTMTQKQSSCDTYRNIADLDNDQWRSNSNDSHVQESVRPQKIIFVSEQMIFWQMDVVVCLREVPGLS